MTMNEKYREVFDTMPELFFETYRRGTLSGNGIYQRTWICFVNLT